MVDLGSGRETIVTAPGPGDAPQIKTFRFDLYKPTARAQANGTATEHAAKPDEPTMTSNFLAYDEGYKDGVSLSTGWVAGAEGGAKSIVTGQLGGAGTVRVWSNGIAARRLPDMYTGQPEPPRRRHQVPADRLLRTVRRRPHRGHGGDHQHHQRGGSTGER